MFKEIKAENIKRGNMLMLFNNRQRFAKYFKCIHVGVPIGFAVGILITFSPEFSKAFGL